MTTKKVIPKIETYNHDTRLREYLMTTFLVMIVYELIAKPYMSYIFTNIITCKSIQKLPQFMNWNKINEDAMRIIFENTISQIICTFSQILPKWLYSSLPWANENLVIVVSSITVTWLLIWLFFKFSNWLYSFKIVREYIKAEPRKELYTDDFWWKLLLTFWLFAILLLPLYITFWTIVLFFVIKEIIDRHNNKINQD